MGCVGLTTVEKQLQNSAELLNSQCPKQLDEITILEEVVASGKTLTHRYTLVGLSDEKILQMKDLLQQESFRQLRSDRGTSTLLEAGATIYLQYWNDNSKLLLTFELRN
ncbi:MAG: hypothetical protein DWQ01_22445 [Planctomycetota bacterium]|nr:MAG: hypothetical protein DWQ01_22445 [Planctomycetota bacterium]